MTAASFAFHAGALRAGQLIRVVNFHNTAAGAADALHQHLARLGRDYACIGLGELDQIFATGQWQEDRPPLLPVFYEGYANHAAVAVPILDELGMTGWFFVPTVFVDCPPADQRAFADAHSIELVEEEASAERLAMTWDEIAGLAERHVIAAHSGTHEQASRITSRDDLEREIFGPWRAITEVTGRPPAATAFLGGSALGASPIVDQAVRAAGYRYVFSNTKIQRLTGRPAAATVPR